MCKRRSLGAKVEGSSYLCVVALTGNQRVLITMTLKGGWSTAGCRAPTDAHLTFSSTQESRVGDGAPQASLSSPQTQQEGGGSCAPISGS